VQWNSSAVAISFGRFNATSSTQCSGTLTLPVAMRALPTIRFSSLYMNFPILNQTEDIVNITATNSMGPNNVFLIINNTNNYGRTVGYTLVDFMTNPDAWFSFAAEL